MSKRFNRRDFLLGGAGAGLARCGEPGEWRLSRACAPRRWWPRR